MTAADHAAKDSSLVTDAALFDRVIAAQDMIAAKTQQVALLDAMLIEYRELVAALRCGIRARDRIIESDAQVFESDAQVFESDARLIANYKELVENDQQLIATLRRVIEFQNESLTRLGLDPIWPDGAPPHGQA